MALATSSRSILLTMSKVFSGMCVALPEGYENVTSEVTRRNGFNAAVLCCRLCAGLSLAPSIVEFWRAVVRMTTGGGTRFSIGPLASALAGFRQFEKGVEIGSGLVAGVF